MQCRWPSPSFSCRLTELTCQWSGGTKVPISRGVPFQHEPSLLEPGICTRLCRHTGCSWCVQGGRKNVYPYPALPFICMFEAQLAALIIVISRVTGSKV